ncbi:MAG: hypothetical protein ACOX8B_05410 [Lachnospiraceae bacterium]|jgi:membrane-associated phospholipid phosphatase
MKAKLQRLRWLASKVKMAFEMFPIFYAGLYFLFYLPAFSLLETYRQPLYIVHCWLDDVIPFSEYFIIPYFLWFAFVPGFMIYLSLRSLDDYWKAYKIVFGGMTVCLCIYLLFPTGLELRQPIEDTNFCAMLVNGLRGIDTPSNVCPSIHVSSTFGIMLTLFRSEKMKKEWKLKIFASVLGGLICISTVMLDQHSIIDVLLGVVLSTVLCGMTEMQKEESMAERSTVKGSIG